MSAGEPDIYALLITAAELLDEHDGEPGLDIAPCASTGEWTARVLDDAGPPANEGAEATGDSGTAAVRALADLLRLRLRAHSSECLVVAGALETWLEREADGG
jgi:hypothetical protein